MSPMPGDTFLTTGEVAARGGVDRTTVHHWAKDGKLPVAQMVNGMRLFDSATVDRFLKSRANSKAALAAERERAS